MIAAWPWNLLAAIVDRVQSPAARCREAYMDGWSRGVRFGHEQAEAELLGGSVGRMLADAEAHANGRAGGED